MILSRHDSVASSLQLQALLIAVGRAVKSAVKLFLVAASPRRGFRSAALRHCLSGLACVLLTALLSGCQTVSYYRQAIAGESVILLRRQSIPKLIADPKTPALLKAKLQTIVQIRQFAADQLLLPPGQSYLKYTDLRRSSVVWNVNIAPPLSLEPMTWWFPVVGRAGYRGYFHEQPARRYAGAFAKKGWDVYVDGVPTYSTLGWFDDPILNTFIDEPDSYLAEIIFHELAHRRLFVPGDTDFNEAWATAVASEGVRRWLLATASPQAVDRYHANTAKDHQIVDLVMSARGQLQDLYANTNLPDTVRLSRKQDIIAQLRASHSELKASWGGQSPYDGWFAEPINNAKLNTISAYYDLVPAFDALLRANGGELEKFYNAVAQLAKLPFPERHRQLQSYLSHAPQQHP
jgi:predicted aminopeptidase